MKILWVCIALALPGTAMAEDCTLTKIGSADIVSEHGNLIVPGTINESPTNVIIDTGSWVSHISPNIVDQQKLPTTRHGFTSISVTGQETDITVLVSKLSVGTLRGTNKTMAVSSSVFDSGGNIGALLGADVLMTMDLDVDFANKKLNFMSQDHCAGRVVYWHPSVVAVVPFRLSDDYHIMLPVTLDGVELKAVLDTGADLSTINMTAAERYFGLAADSPGVSRDGAVNGDTKVIGYKHKFKTLSFGGITIANLAMEMVPDKMKDHEDNTPPTGSLIPDRDFQGMPDVLIGAEELRHLHVYIAYKEKKIYISPAQEAPAVASTAQGTTTAGH
jgi:hypothetical protein